MLYPENFGNLKELLQKGDQPACLPQPAYRLALRRCLIAVLYCHQSIYQTRSGYARGSTTFFQPRFSQIANRDGKARIASPFKPWQEPPSFFLIVSSGIDDAEPSMRYGYNSRFQSGNDASCPLCDPAGLRHSNAGIARALLHANRCGK